jgi:hypothetical protein
MYYMKRRKPRYDPRLLSFTFEVLADHIERIREENLSDADTSTPAASQPAEPTYDSGRLLAELKAQRDQVEQEALRQGRMPVFDARLNERIAKLERPGREKNPGPLCGMGRHPPSL